ncbi:glycosyltransferase family 4 protein [Solimicrobium silvestre]|uniref:Glycosyltransferase n=1 Tax=Solimicrobium silvestre TaxID=2099400 RepID=A0A2S9GTD7_9BURK|nr:glycosyltransferase family 4 protein [Solimicrobium silvestre]PRC90966.1 Glycosyltransferase [Solimicrobium silvestre]
MKLLTFSTLYPNAEQANHGIFVETRLRYLVASGQAESRVIAPIPWFPSKHPHFGRYASFARVPEAETRQGIHIDHPRYTQIPKIGMHLSPLLMAHSLKKTLARIIDEGYDFDLIDAHYFYPDGVAAVMLGKYFNKPVVITARGTDINLIPQYHLPKKMILWAAKNARGVITVCHALKDEMVKLGVPSEHITPLRNGVDLQRFQPMDRQKVRQELGLQHFTLLSVGSLTTHKGHDLVIRALSSLTDIHLMIAGSGPEHQKLHELAQQLGVADRVQWLGSVPQTELKTFYSAADALVLVSSREGWANVLLESMACGTPVIASNVGGSPEVVTSLDAGILISERTPQALIAAIHSLRANYPEHEATRRYAEKFSWDETTQGQLRLFNTILNGGKAQ